MKYKYKTVGAYFRLKFVFLWIFRGALFYSNEIQQYAIPFMGSDPSVVKRSQRFLVEEHKATPVCVRIEGYEILFPMFFIKIFCSWWLKVLQLSDPLFSWTIHESCFIGSSK